MYTSDEEEEDEDEKEKMEECRQEREMMTGC